MRRINKKMMINILFMAGLLSSCTAFIPDSMIKAAHQDMDTNHDGYVDYQEYLKTGTQKEIAREAQKKGMSVEEYSHWDFNRVDANRDGRITLQELLNFAK